MEKSEIAKLLSSVKSALMSQGYVCSVSADDFQSWFETGAPHGAGIDEVLKNPLLIVHSLVEINEAKKMGVTIAKDMIIGNPEKIDEAHIIAAEMELDFAMARCEYAHIKKRMNDFKAWCEDNRIAEKLKDRYKKHYEKAFAYVSRAEKHGLI